MAACVRSAWSENGATTLASMRVEIAQSVGADWRDKIVVASLSAEVSSLLGVDFPNLTYVAAVVGKKVEAVPQLVSRVCSAKHVFEVGESMCLRHGRRCSLRYCDPIDVLVADRVLDVKMLATTVSLVQPRVVAVLVAGARVIDDSLKTALGDGWEVSSLFQRAGSLGLPLTSEIAIHFLRRSGAADPAQFLRTLRTATVVPMENLLKSVESSLEEGWGRLLAKTRETPESEDQQFVVREVAKKGHLPGCEADLAPYSFPSLLWAKLSAARKRRAVELLAWVVHSVPGGSACCDLDAVRGSIYVEAALPVTGGLKMFIAVRRGAAGGLVVKTLAPCHVLAVRGYGQPGHVNLSTLAPMTAQRAAEAAMPAAAATASLLAVMRAKNRM